MPAWRVVSTTSTLEWERQLDEKGMEMNRRGGGCCCSRLMAPLDYVPALVAWAADEPNRNELPLDLLVAGASTERSR